MWKMPIGFELEMRCKVLDPTAVRANETLQSAPTPPDSIQQDGEADRSPVPEVDGAATNEAQQEMQQLPSSTLRCEQAGGGRLSAVAGAKLQLDM